MTKDSPPPDCLFRVWITCFELANGQTSMRFRMYLSALTTRAGVVFLFAVALLLQVTTATASRAEWKVDPETGCEIWSGDPQVGETMFWTGPGEDGTSAQL